jgi:predicted TIM-barrel fold metal-dependent hydrolase
VPPAWLAFLKEHPPQQPPDSSPPSWELSQHLEAMDRGGIATSLLSLPMPGLWHGPDVAAIRKVTRDVNEYYAKLAADHPRRFGMFATLPLPDIDGSLREAEYAFDSLNADGIAMKTPYATLWHGDALFTPLYEELNRRRAVVYTHPQDAPCCNRLVPGVGAQTIEYATHTTRTIVSLLESGMAARYPDIRWVFSHAGGTMPFLVARIVSNDLIVGDDGLVMVGPNEDSLRRGGAERLGQLRRFFYEAAQQSNPVAHGALRRVVPVSQIVFGTDYPYRSVEEHVTGLSRVFSGAELRAIESENALRLFPKYRA